MLLERAEADKMRMSESKNRLIIELRENYASHIEHISMTLEDYLNTGIILHDRIKSQEKVIEQRDSVIDDLKRKIVDLENEITSQKIRRDNNRLSMETLGMQLNEEKTIHEFYFDEFLKIQKNYDGLMTAFNLKNKANENLMIERNKARGIAANLKALLKKQEAEIKSNKTKIIELKTEVDILSTEKKMIIKERDHHYKKLKEANNLVLLLRNQQPKIESTKLVKRLSGSARGSIVNQSRELDYKDLRMSSNLLDVQHEEHSRSVMEGQSSTKSIPSMAQKLDKITILDSFRNQEVQTITYEDIIRSWNEQKKQDCVDAEQQTNESSFFKNCQVSVEVQTALKAVISRSTETNQALFVPMLDNLSISRNLDTDNSIHANTQRNNINTGLTITPRVFESTDAKESDSKSLKLESLMESSEVIGLKRRMEGSPIMENTNYQSNDLSGDVVGAREQRNKKPVVIIKKEQNKNNVFSSVDIPSLKNSRFDKRSDSHGIQSIKKRLISPIKEEKQDLCISYLKGSNISRFNFAYKRIANQSDHSKRTDLEGTSSQLQNVLSSKYDAGMTQVFDMQRTYFSNNENKRERVKSNSPDKCTNQDFFPCQNPSMNTTFNSVSTKFVMKPKFNPQMNVLGK